MAPDRSGGDRYPVRLLKWEERDDGCVAVLRPKFGPGRFGAWMSQRMRRPHCRVNLDAYGSRVWKQCDGNRSMHEIGRVLETAAEDPAGDLSSRLAMFFHRLEREGMIGWAEHPREAVTDPRGRAN